MVTTAKTAQSRYWFRYRPSWKQFTLYLAIAFSFCHLATNNRATAATYYLDAVNGDDNNLGTSSSQPLRRAMTSWSGLGTKVTDGDTVLLTSGSYGIYTESKVSRSNWITYKAATDANVRFDKIDLISYDPDPNADYPAYLKFDGIKVENPDPNASAVRCHTVNNVQLCNLKLIGGGYRYPHGYDVKSSKSKAIYLYKAHDIDINGCHIYGTGPSYAESWPGIRPSYDDTSADANKHGQGWVYGVYAYPAYANISVCNCLIEQCDYGVYLHATPNDTVTNNHFRYLTSDAIGIAEGRNNVGSQRTLIAYNHIHELYSFYNADGENLGTHNDGIQFYDSNPRCDYNNMIVQSNKIYNVEHQGLFLKPGSASSNNWLVENNLVYNVPASSSDESLAVWIYAADNVVFRNNTVIGKTWFENGNGTLEVNEITGNIIELLELSTEKGTTINYENYNIVNRRWIDMEDHIMGDHSVVLNNRARFEALFNNYNANDFNLAPNSIAINFGNQSYAPVSDILGNSRSFPPDAGCYEYVVSDPNNHAPVLETIGNKSVSENSLLSFTVSATDTDDDTLIYSATNLPSGATFASQTFSWTPGYTQAETYSVTFGVSDGRGGADSKTITITVINVNRAPVLAAIGNKSVNEGSALSFSIIATDADGDNLTYPYPTSMPSGAAFAGQTFTWTPTQAGTYQVTFTVRDPCQATDSETITITVTNVNSPPVLNTIGSKSVYVNEPLSFTISATDPDGDTITYLATGLPSGATFTSQSFRWTPAPSQAGTCQVTFIASDGQIQDSEAITITVYADDTSAPTVNSLSPAADSIQVPLNSLVILHVTDSGTGVDANSVTIKVNNNTVYTGNTADYSSPYGHCRRAGTEADYAFIYQSNTTFDYDQTVNVVVNAKDLAGNTMNQYSYSFATEMRSFGKNKIVNSASDSLNKGNPATVRDSEGNIWVAWHAGQTNSREVYVGRLAAGADDFDASVQVTSNSADQYNAAIAIDASDKLYLVWQDNRRGNWDIYISTSVDGINWSAERRVTDSNNNATNPAIAVDHSSPPKAYIAWQDDRASNQEIYIASSSDGFATGTISGITSDSSNQIDPAIAVNASNTVYVVWADSRNGSSDIYGAASNNGPWTNVPVVVKPANQTSPAIATEAAGAILHLLWVDDTTGNKDIYYAASNGLPTTPLTGRNIVDYSSGADQLAPAIITTGSTGTNLKVFACWQDKRHIASNGDTDLFFWDVNSGSGTNIFVGDDSTNSNQSTPAIGIDGYGYPYLVWADDRNQNTDIYYAGSTFVQSPPLASKSISPFSDATIGTDPASITSVDDVSIVMPAGAYPCELTITISKMENPPNLLVPLLSFIYDFGPSGVVFDKPVTITIPYSVSAESTISAYWYNTLADKLSQQGLTDVNTIVISSTLHAFRFKTTHFTPFLIGGSSGGSSGGSGGGGGGGCALSSPGQASFVEFLLPYIGLAAVMIVINRRDKRKREISSATGNEH